MIRVAFICVGFVLTNTVSRMRLIVIQASSNVLRGALKFRDVEVGSKSAYSLLEYLEETEVALPSASPLSLRERELWLEQETKRPVKLTFTRNRRQMLSWKPEAGKLKVRAHEMFRDASHEIWCAVVSYFLDGDRLCGQVVDQFIERELRHWSQENARQEPIRSVGKYHHLGELFDELNNEFFHQCLRFANHLG